MGKGKKIVIIVINLLIVLVLIGGTYAYSAIARSGSKRQVVKVGDITLILNEGQNLSQISLTNSIPMKDEEGMKTEEFTFSVENPGTVDVNYVLYLIDNAISGETSRVSDEAIKYYLKKNDVARTPALVSTLAMDTADRVLDSGKISAKTTNYYSLRFWLDYYNAGNEVMGQEFSVRIVLEASYETPTVSISEAIFDSKKLSEKCTTYNDGIDTFLVGQCSNNYVWYSGKLWRVILKNNETGAIKLVTDKAITVITYNEKGNSAFEYSYADQWLNQEFLPTLHHYEDYLVTDSVWDVTLDNSTIPSRPNGTTTLERTVGLLNAYEYYTTYNNSGGLATSRSTYLTKDRYRSWYFLTPFSETDVLYVDYIYSNISNVGSSYQGNGIRPSIYLKSSVQIESGVGTESVPYILEDDRKVTANGVTLLSTRYSGEYVTFNGELYRIIGVENGLTKITAVSPPSSLTGVSYDESGNNADFANASIKTTLENYYQSLKLLNENVYNMIVPNATWYLGMINNSDNNYKDTVCTKSDRDISTLDCAKTEVTAIASIGLPRIGEMFTSQQNNSYFGDNLWTLTPYDEYSRLAPMIVSSSDEASYRTDLIQDTGYYDARPCMYLKNNVVIASGNIGNGTYGKPYSIELGF